MKDINSPSLEIDKLVSFEWERNHEKFTVLALQCIADKNAGLTSLDVAPEYCEKRTINLDQMSLYNKSYNYPKELERYKSLVKHVRWSDDPTRQVYDTKKSSPKFAATMKKYCESIIENSEDGEINLAANGLLCASHFGRFQYLHSMAINDGIEAKVTFNKILSWSKFAYQFSLSEKDHNENYCEYWENNKIYPNIVDSFQVESFRNRKDNFCERRKISKWNWITNPKLWGSNQEYYEAWTVKSFFSNECTGKFGSGQCTVIEDKDEIMFSALGSILHLVQDSYSKSHVSRGGTPALSEIVCSPPENFHSYLNQDSDTHTKADKWPVFHSTCNLGSGGTLDPITAVAQIIFLHAKGEKDVKKIEDIITKVYGGYDLNAKSKP